MAEQTDAPSPSLILAPQRGSSRPTARGSIGGIKNINGWRSSRQQASAAQTTQSDGSKVEETASDKEKKSDEVELANDAKDTSSTSIKSPMRPPEGESPLENSWCFWFDRRAKVKGRNASYESNLKRIGGFCTVEGMWGFLNHMTKPTQVEHGANYHLFKENIKPMWEDKANANGGKWVVHIKGGRHHLDTYWLNLVCFLRRQVHSPFLSLLALEKTFSVHHDSFLHLIPSFHCFLMSNLMMPENGLPRSSDSQGKPLMKVTRYVAQLCLAVDRETELQSGTATKDHLK